MSHKSTYNYFDMFVRLVDYSCRSAQMLYETLEHFELDDLSTKLEEMHTIEHAADVDKHDMMNKLAREFITPIEREDIIQLAQEIDNVTDAIEDVLIRIYMFNLQALRPEALDFSDKIVSCCNALREATNDFHNFRKSPTIKNNIIEVNRLEEEADALFTDAVRSLYTTCKDPIQVVAWTQTFNRFEKCCDACEHVANILESIIMKNT